MSLPEPTPTLTEEEAKDLFKKLRNPQYVAKVKELYKNARELYEKHPF